jgi:hypothetical protein
MEIFLPQYRGTAGAVLECYWGVTVIIMAGIAYLLQNWRYIQIAISVHEFVLVLEKSANQITISRVRVMVFNENNMFMISNKYFYLPLLCKLSFHTLL